MSKLASVIAGIRRRRGRCGDGSPANATVTPSGCVWVGLATTFNVFANAVTLGHYIWLEGTVRRGSFLNWGRHYRYKPKPFKKPKTEQEIVDCVNSSARLRVVGSGHSFNSGIVSEQTLMSLDDHSGCVRYDPELKQLTVRGGTRVREVVRLLRAKGLAFPALPSHDAQSIAGVLSTDVHGTSNCTERGFISESVVRLRLVDGRGQTHECGPSDDLFKAAVGGIGAVGVITEVVVQGVDRFDVEQRVESARLSDVERNLGRLVEKHDHLSLYLFPFSDICQVNIWERTTEPRSRLGRQREFFNISIDVLLAAWVGGLVAYMRWLHKERLRAITAIVRGAKVLSSLVLESNRAFNRTLYHLHQELEFSVPFDEALATCKRFIDLYEELYEKERVPFTLIEVRFTPAGHDCTLIGPGGDRRCAWIDLVCNDSHGVERYYAAAEDVINDRAETVYRIGARRHLGKWCEGLDKAEMTRLYGPKFDKFLEFVKEHDPAQKFANDFTRRLFDP
jgi:FAD/FMN-containing dehydrogenase